MNTKISYHLIALLLLASFNIYAGKNTKLVILHTNDTHSQIEPSDKSLAKNADLGGYARRLGAINKIRVEEKNVILLDAGDFSQGTPYFNFYGGRVEIQAMNKMGYDAATLGNHEFDNGMDSLAMVLSYAKFPFVNANYNVEETPLKKFLKPYAVLKKSGLKIGIFGIGVKPEGLIFQKNYNGMTYEDPIEKSIEISDFLKNTEKCDVIICLSHLGADVTDTNPTDWNLAKSSKNIDVIIGGHSHMILENQTQTNSAGKPVIIAQMGKSGFYMGRIDLNFEKK